MSQYDFGVINPATKSGSALASDLNSWRDALHSCHSGISRPTYAVAGTLWLDTSVSPNLVKIYDGTDDIVLGYLNTTTNIFRPYHVVRGVLLVKTVAQNVATGGAISITMNTSVYDTETTWSSGANITVPSGITYARINAQLTSPAQTTGSFTRIDVNKNGTNYNGMPGMRLSAGNGVLQILNISSPIISVSSGDTIQLVMTHDATGSLSVSFAYLGVEWVA